MRFYYFFIIFYFYLLTSFSQVQLSAKNPFISINLDVKVWEDKEGTATIGQVSATAFEPNFHSLKKDFNQGISASIFWMYIDVQSRNISLQDWLLYTSNAFLDEIQFYQQEKNIWKKNTVGILHPFSDRTIKQRYIATPLSLKDTLVHRIFLRLYSKTTLQVPLFIERGSVFSQSSREVELFYGIFIGITGLMLFGSLFYWFYFKEREYLYYTVFLIGAIIFYLSISGHLFQFFWQNNGYYGKLFLGVGIGLWFVGAGLFTKTFLQTFRYFPLASKLMNIYVGMGIYMIVSVFILPYRIFTVQILVLGNIGHIVITCIGFVCWRRGNYFAKYFVIGWIFYLIGTLMLTLYVIGLLPRSFLAVHLGEISCIFKIIMFAVALSYKGRIKHEKIRQDRLRSQQKVIELQKNTTQHLERQVQARTKDLEGKQTEVEIQNQELRKQQEELEISRNQLREQNKIIEEQNNYLKSYNENLASLVEEKTKQLIQTNAELINHNLRLEQFAFITAHNLRSPVAQLLGLTYIFDTKNLSDPLNTEIMGHISTSAQVLQRTLQDLGEILDIRKGKEQSVELLAFEEYAQEVYEELLEKNDVEQTSIRFNFQQATHVHFVKIYLKSIFYNFISNAFKYRSFQRGLELEIYTKAFDEETCLTFKDNGIGIDLEKYGHKLFGLYQRFNVEREGKGMGLYLSKTQIESLGGRIEVQSQLNKGTQFDIYFKNNLRI